MSVARIGAVAASRRRSGGGAPTVLGYNTKGSATNGHDIGRMYVSKFTLASALTLNELHGWFGSGSSGDRVRIVLYADSAGSPAARLAYTNQFALTGSDIELVQTGFSVALPAADYWLGFQVAVWVSGTSVTYCEATGGTHTGKTSGAADPPDNPFGSTNTSGTRKLSIWAILT
jgi:hypothetical protein